ncbi:MAG: helix-turn-helix transcriptional regulator [Saprospiraceae bacterium]|nr:helix-turn-helix transcriptional regulator [Saprospiraceae bacterium]
MPEPIVHIKSIAQLHQLLGYEKPTHPLITVIDASKLVVTREMVGARLLSDLYYIGMKDGSCGMDYGRNQYDFEEGVLFFTAPGQVVSPTREQKANDIEGWMIYFHPDLIRKSPLGEHIDEYTFFSYDVHEALHVSDQEKEVLTACIQQIKVECDQRIDNHSQRVITSNLELLLNYAMRFYERQFNTRTNIHQDTVAQFEKVLKAYFNSDQIQNGLPPIQYFAEKLHLSPNYLSDLLRKESGRSAKDFINDYVVEKAKNMLLGSNDAVSEIAYNLGFNYPHYFSRLFKTKTGMTPQQYRDAN